MKDDFSPKDGGDDFIIGNGFQISDNEPEKPGRSSVGRHSAPLPQKRRKKKKKRSMLSTIIWTLCIAAVSIGLAAGICLGMADIIGIGKKDSETKIELEIKPGDNIPGRLKEEGIINYPFLFRLFVKLKKVDGSSFQTGIYWIKKSAGYSGIIDILKTEGARADTVDVRIPEAASMPTIKKLLVEANVCTEDEFNEAIKSKTTYDNIPFTADIPVEIVNYRFEGYFYPDTYSFFTRETPNAAVLAVEKMLKQTQYYLSAEILEAAAVRGFNNAHEILTMASIIEAECNGYPEEMPNVSMVFQNRLNHWEGEQKLLGSTPTTNYLKGTSANDKYNTDKRPGLPVGPICTVTKEAIRAVAFPNEIYEVKKGAAGNETTTREYTDAFGKSVGEMALKDAMYFFVTDKNFKFYYNKDVAGHDATIKRLKTDKLWA
ncbi:MAG: endolytic transglycosylase MltG [Oscillospiraceae bacterium]|jgi:UPF0755 protein|nr:endolytic transglycosylase MltG [Oscillospiraceae bacterium]